MRQEAARSLGAGLTISMIGRTHVLLALLVAAASFAHWGAFGVDARNYAGAIFGTALFLAFWVVEACFRYERARRLRVKRASARSLDHLKQLHGTLIEEARLGRAATLVDALDRLWRARTSVEGLLGRRLLPAIDQETVRLVVDEVAATALESGLHRLRLGATDERTEAKRTELERLVSQGVALVQRGVEVLSDPTEGLAERVDRLAQDCREHVDRSKAIHANV